VDQQQAGFGVVGSDLDPLHVDARLPVDQGMAHGLLDGAVRGRAVRLEDEVADAGAELRQHDALVPRVSRIIWIACSMSSS
jgi:hypothetical protein